MKTMLALFACSITLASAQLPRCPLAVEWQISLGGPELEQVYAVHQLADGGYIVGGGGVGFWAARLDAQGSVLWLRRYDGGYLSDLQPTADGGFILGGGSFSSASDYDFRIVRLDHDGNKLWDRNFGGAGFDFSYGLQQTTDGGYILGGISSSPPGGDKTSPAYGSNDFWLVRCDADGNKLWDHSYGGTGREFWARARQTADGGFVMIGTTESGADGNKSTPGFGVDDAWIVRLDSAGNKLWDQTVGGAAYEYLGEVVEMPAGGFIAAGWSQSPPGGNKTSPQFGGGDGWVLCLNANGSLRWEQSFGGTNSDFLVGVAKTSDGGYVAAGQGAAGVSGNKASAGGGAWLVRLDAAGHKLWDYGTGLSPIPIAVKQTFDGGFVLAGDTFDNENLNNGWALKLGPEGENCDSDGDGVLDVHDQCPNTHRGDVVNAQGCSVTQLCPCDGPWRNHAEYLRCIQRTSAQFQQLGLITAEQRRAVISEATRSDCGKR
jgi:hypothetical protein